MKSSLSIWRYVASVKSTVKISLIFVAFLENMNFTKLYFDCKNGSWNSNFESYLQYVWSTTPHTSGSENIQALGERRPFDNYSHFFPPLFQGMLEIW